MIRLDREVPRGAELQVERAELPAPEDGSYYVFQLVGLAVEEEGGRALGHVEEVTPGPANDVLELDTGLALPLVDACVQEVDLDSVESLSDAASQVLSNLKLLCRSMSLPSSPTHLPGSVSSVRSRPSSAPSSTCACSTTATRPRSRAARSTMSPTGRRGHGAAVDTVAAALDATYGGRPEHRVIALTPQGRQLDQPLVEELASEGRLTILSARFEGFDERIVEHLATEAVSIGPYVLSGGELPAMVMVDAIARAARGAERGVRRRGDVLRRLEGGFEYPHYTRPAEFRGWKVPDVLLSGDHARIAEWRREQSRARTAQ